MLTLGLVQPQGTRQRVENAQDPVLREAGDAVVRIILMGRHEDRTDLGREFGATDVVAERGEEGIERVREPTRGDGTHAVLEAVGNLSAYEMAVGVVRADGVISRVGVPRYEEAAVGFGTLFGPNHAHGRPGPGARTSRNYCRTC